MDLTIIGDLRDRKTLENLPKDVDLVIHLAANARVYNLVVDPRLARDKFEILFNTLEFCRKNNIKRVYPENAYLVRLIGPVGIAQPQLHNASELPVHGFIINR